MGSGGDIYSKPLVCPFVLCQEDPFGRLGTRQRRSRETDVFFLRLYSPVGSKSLLKLLSVGGRTDSREPLLGTSLPSFVYRSTILDGLH